MGAGLDIFEPLASFCALANEDTRMTAVHISIYITLLNTWQLSGRINPLPVTRKSIMWAAKISSRTTYNKTINELAEYGYIKYVPSADPRVKSGVWLAA